MAIQQVLIDDLDGSTNDILTVRFSLDGRDYAVDLNPEHRTEFREALAPYVKVARNGQSRHVPRTTRPTNLAEVRLWATNNGFRVGDRGRISREIRDAYDAAH